MYKLLTNVDIRCWKCNSCSPMLILEAESVQIAHHVDIRGWKCNSCSPMLILDAGSVIVARQG